jgi:hypothetical protein
MHQRRLLIPPGSSLAYGPRVKRACREGFPRASVQCGPSATICSPIARCSAGAHAPISTPRLRPDGRACRLRAARSNHVRSHGTGPKTGGNSACSGASTSSRWKPWRSSSNIGSTRWTRPEGLLQEAQQQAPRRVARPLVLLQVCRSAAGRRRSDALKFNPDQVAGHGNDRREECRGHRRNVQ